LLAATTSHSRHSRATVSGKKYRAPSGVFATLDTSIATTLVVAGEGIERPGLERLAGELGIADRVVFTGQVAPEAVLGTFDIFALSSDTEQMPNALLEALRR